MKILYTNQDRVAKTQEFFQINRKANLSEEVAARIKESILNGRYGPGDALTSENRLADQFGVSRVVVREALKELKSKGLVEIRRGPKGGPYVTQLSHLNFGEQFSEMILFRQMTVEQLFQVRLLIEPEVVRLVMRQISDDQIVQLHENVDATKAESNPIHRKNLLLTFYRQLGHISGNPFYALLMDSFMEFVDRFTAVINPGTYNHHDDFHHEEIMEAIAERDEDRALTLVRAHLIDIRGKMIEQEKEYMSQTAQANS
jgi:DNA-binding FadR family transcriptional regulator